MEATPAQAAEGQALCRVLANVLDRLVQANGHLARLDPGQVTRFHAMKAPGITVQAYLERIHKYASCSNECFVLALIYIDRLIQRSNFLLTELNVHRVVITAVLLAAKFFDDAYYNNAYYAKVGGVLVSEMNGLEVDFLFRINFSLHVASDVFSKYRGELMVHSSSLSMVNSNSMMTTMQQQPVLETMAATSQQQSYSHYSPQTIPMQSANASSRIQATAAAAGAGGGGGSQFYQVTPSPPTPDYLPPDYAIMNQYEVLQHSAAAAGMQLPTHDLGFHPIDSQLQQVHHGGGSSYLPLDVAMRQRYPAAEHATMPTPLYYPQHFNEQSQQHHAYYQHVQPIATGVQHVHYGAAPQDCSASNGW
ncbi:hypothetical protein MPSEU_000301200 [Mayamaea pseudoterrestris]|nr:hypothetical protein MPSEU_000301200 [Mayamaea pseudoterrestris]